MKGAKDHCVCGHERRDHNHGTGCCRKPLCGCDTRFTSKPAEATYRVEFRVNETGAYAPYTSRKNPVDFGMAQAYAGALVRQGQAGRIIKIENKAEEVIKEWL